VDGPCNPARRHNLTASKEAKSIKTSEQPEHSQLTSWQWHDVLAQAAGACSLQRFVVPFVGQGSL
jgi:hypothetical protein